MSRFKGMTWLDWLDMVMDLAPFVMLIVVIVWLVLS